MRKYLETVDELMNLSKQKISIYGAGAVARALLNYGVGNGLITSVQRIVVSSRSGYLNEMFHIPVLAINEVTVNKESVFLVATKEELHDEITDMLLKHKISDIYYLKNELADKLLGFDNAISDDVIRALPRKSLKFEVHLTEHCNLNCRGCYHFSPLASEEYLLLSDYERDCTRLSQLYDGMASQILLLGGEPLLHPDIEGFLNVTRSCFKNAVIKVVTNGILLVNMKDSFWINCNKNNIIVAPTKYPIEVAYEKIEKKAKSFGVYVDYFNDSQIEKTLEYTPLDLSGSQDKDRNFAGCYRANECITLRNGRLYTCIVPAHIHHFAKYFNIVLPDFESDGIDIYEVNSPEEISEFLTTPIDACKYCDRKNCVSGIEWGLSTKAMSEWT